MSTASLPSYHFEPQGAEQRLAQRFHVHRPQGNFVKNSRTGGVVLRLANQHDDASLPEYGRGASVEGTVELKNVEGIQGVEVKIEGALRLKEIAEGGTNTSSLCLDVKTLWSAANDAGACPTSLHFSLTLPTTYNDTKATYPLPPTYEAHLSGVPGFSASIDYSVTATVVRKKTRIFTFANSSISTSFLYRPRSRPALPLPTSLTPNFTHPSAIFNEDWSLHETAMRAKSPRGDSINVKLYLPASHVFAMSEPLPFHLFLTSSAFSLAAFLPLAPASSPAPSPPPSVAGGANNTPLAAPDKQGVTRITLLRQTAVDVRSISKRNPLPRGNNTDIWKTVQIGEGVFRRYGSTPNSPSNLGAGGQDWMAWYGEVRVDPAVLSGQDKLVGGFKASGLTVKDYVVLQMNPPDPGKSPFTDMRLVVPVKLTTDPWSADEYGAELGMHIAGYGDGSDPDLYGAPDLAYRG